MSPSRSSAGSEDKAGERQRRRPRQAPARPRQQRRVEGKVGPAGPEQAAEGKLAAQTTGAPATAFAGGTALVFTVHDQRFGLLVEHVVQIIEMVAISPLPTGPDLVSGVIDFHGQVIPVVDLRRRFGWPTQPYSLRTPIIIGRLADRLVGLVVDGVSGVVDLQAGQVELTDQIVPVGAAGQTQYLSGVARLNDGLLLLLDPATLLTPQEERAARGPAARRAAAPAARKVSQSRRQRKSPQEEA